MADNTVPGGTVTNTNSNAWTTPYWQNWYQHLQSITPPSMPVYQGPTVAPWNQNQNTAADMSRQLATNGTPAYNAATGTIANIAGGGVQNPYMGQPNPYMGAVNPYMGTNPFTQQVINGTNQNMIDAYQRGTAAQTDAAMARQGAYGGSGYNELTAANNKAFGQALGNVDSQLLNQNFLNSGNLWQQGQNLNANLALQEQGLNGNLFNTGVGQQLQGAGLGLASQGTDLAAINNLYGMGANQQGQTQAVLNGMQDYWNRTVQAPFVSSSILGNGLSQASGVPPTSTTSTGTPPPPSWLSYAGAAGSFIAPWLTG